MRFHAPARILAAFLLSATALASCSDNTASEAPPKSGNEVATDVEATQSESTRLNVFFERVHNENLARSPQWQTSRGLKTNNDKWDNISEEAREEHYQRARDRLAELKTFDFEKLDAAASLSWRVFQHGLENTLKGYEFRHHRYAITQNGGVHTSRTQFLLNTHRIDTVEDAKAYVTRAKTIDVPLGHYILRLKRQIDLGIIVPKFAFPPMLESLDLLLSGAPFEEAATEDSALLKDFKKKISGLDISDEERTRLIDELTAGLLEAYQPSLQKIQDIAVTMEQMATTDDGIWKLPNGEAYYNHRLAYMTTTSMTADEIHAFGIEDVARIHKEMEALIAQMGFEGTLQDYFEHTRTSDHFYYPDTDEGRQRYIDDAQKAIDRAHVKIADYLKFPLTDELEVRAVEKYRQRGSPLAFYSGPARDGSRPGIFYINTIDMKRLPSYQMEALAFHEGVPGHHYQISVTQNLTGLPEFRKDAFYYSYAEGWGLYAERLAHEMGLYSSLEAEFGRLTMELWRAMRLVADTGLHAKRWTRQETIDYMTNNSPLDAGNISVEVERYVTNAGQATTYKIGMRKLLELRAHARSELGDAFDIKEYHDTILKDGGLPMAILEERVEEMIERTKANAS